MSIEFRSIKVDTGGPDEEGTLAFVSDRLAAVLVQLSAQHGDMAGLWFVEAAFGRFDDPSHPVFSNLDSARDWLQSRH